MSKSEIKTRFVYNRKGKQEGVIIPVQEFDHLVDELEEYNDYQYIKTLTKKDRKEVVSLEEVKKRLFGK